MYEVTIIDILNCIFSFLMIVIGGFGIKGLYNLKKQQHEACYGFYINFTIYLQQLSGLITFGTDMPGWIKLLGKSFSEKTKEEYKADKNNLSKAAEFAEEMLKFLRESTNQVPPNKCAIDDRKIKFEIIKKFLLQVIFCQKLNNVSSGWTEEKYKKSYQDLVEAVNGLISMLYKTMNIEIKDDPLE